MTGRMPAALAAALLLGVASPGAAMAAGQMLPPAALGAVMSDATPDRIHVAQGQDAAQLMVRIQQLEEQIRTLNGQMDGLTFQLTQMQTLIERMTEDNEFRFQALEGGAGGKTDAATQPGGVTQPEALPQDMEAAAPTQIPEQGVRPLPGEAEFDPTFTDGSTTPGDAVGASSDPLIGTGGGVAGAALGTGEPLDLSFDPNQKPSGNPDADAQFAAAAEAMSRNEYGFAEDQLRQFLGLYPDNAQMPDAANLLGEVLIRRAAYDEAAEVLLNAFQKAPDSPKAPELLLKLGMSISGAGERETACRTFSEIDKRYTTLTPDFLAQLAGEKAKAECPPA
ncbi:hypothetical protein VW29_02065 [Devosia limi DSM 17137]|nr:hypothetical protein VW29_02065 [Devosia limi DSM 17137]